MTKAEQARALDAKLRADGSFNNFCPIARQLGMRPADVRRALQRHPRGRRRLEGVGVKLYYRLPPEAVRKAREAYPQFDEQRACQETCWLVLDAWAMAVTDPLAQQLLSSEPQGISKILSNHERGVLADQPKGEKVMT